MEDASLEKELAELGDVSVEDDGSLASFNDDDLGLDEVVDGGAGGDDDEGDMEDDTLVDYGDSKSDEEEEVADSAPKAQVVTKGSYAAVNTSSFSDLMIKEEILRAIGDCGFEHPSEVQHESIPQALLGLDIICQAKSGMGKTAVFVIATLQQVELEDYVNTLVLCHARELAYQICREFERFSKHMSGFEVAVIFGGIPINEHINMLKGDCPQVVVGTPGRVLDLVNRGELKLDKIKRFILDECDRMLGTVEMRRDVQLIFKQTPREKQVMLFSATISDSMKKVCKKFTKNPIEIYVDDDEKLTLYGLQQHFVELGYKEKRDKLTDLLDSLEFNQVVIFCSTVKGVNKLHEILKANAFPTTCIHGRIPMQDRLTVYERFRTFRERILVSTDLFERGVDIERVNIVINFDMPNDSDSYLHRVGRAGRFGTRGLAITFVSSQEDSKMLEEIQSRFKVKITPLPDKIDASTYMTS